MCLARVRIRFPCDMDSSGILFMKGKEQSLTNLSGLPGYLKRFVVRCRKLMQFSEAVINLLKAIKDITNSQVGTNHPNYHVELVKAPLLI